MSKTINGSRVSTNLCLKFKQWLMEGNKSSYCFDSTCWSSCFWAWSWSCCLCSSSFCFWRSSAFFLSSSSCWEIWLSNSFSSSSVKSCCWSSVCKKNATKIGALHKNEQNTSWEGVSYPHSEHSPANNARNFSLILPKIHATAKDFIPPAYFQE